MSGLDLGCIYLVRTQRGGGGVVHQNYCFSIQNSYKGEGRGGNTRFLAYVLNTFSLRIPFSRCPGWGRNEDFLPEY